MPGGGPLGVFWRPRRPQASPNAERCTTRWRSRDLSELRGTTCPGSEFLPGLWRAAVGRRACRCPVSRVSVETSTSLAFLRALRCRCAACVRTRRGRTAQWGTARRWVFVEHARGPTDRCARVDGSGPLPRRWRGGCDNRDVGCEVDRFRRSIDLAPRRDRGLADRRSHSSDQAPRRATNASAADHNHRGQATGSRRVGETRRRCWSPGDERVVHGDVAAGGRGGFER